MPDQLRVSEKVLYSSAFLFTSRLKRPVRLAREHVAATAWVSKIIRREGLPDVRPGSPTSGAGHPSGSESLWLCQQKSAE